MVQRTIAEQASVDATEDKFMKFVFRLIGLTALAASGAAPALTPAEDAILEKLKGTVFVKQHRETADGRLQACGLEFSVLTRDFSTKGGAPIKLVGSYYVRGRGENTAVALKLGVFEPIGGDISFAPKNAFVRAPRGEAPSQVIPAGSETSGYGLYVSGIDESFLETYRSISDKKQFVVAFNRKAGQQDVSSTVDLTVVSTSAETGEVKRQRSTEMVDDFMACTLSLMKR